MRARLWEDVREERPHVGFWASLALLASAVVACVPREDSTVIGDGGTSGAGGSSSAAGGSGGTALVAGPGGSGQSGAGASSGAGSVPEPQVRCDSFDEAACISQCLDTEVALRNDGGTVDMAADCKQAYADVLACQIAGNYWKCDNIPDSTKCFLAGYHTGCGLVDAGSIPTHPVAPYWSCDDQMRYLQGCVAGWYRPITPLDAGADADIADAAPSPSLEPLCAEVCRLQYGYHIRDSGAPP